MRRKIMIAAVAVAALATAGLAMGQLRATGTEEVSATFAAAKERATTRVCRGTDGTYEITRGTYRGESDSANAMLDGPLVLNIYAVYNTTEKLGWMEGRLRIRRDGEDEADRRAWGHFHATLKDGAVEGFVWGRIGHRWSHLAANFASRLTSNDGFTTGQLGGGGGSNVAVLAGRPCEGRPQIAVRLNVKGTVESITNDAITVKPRDGSNSQTCARKPVSPNLNGYANGNRVEMGCGVVDNTLTLLRIHKLR